VHARSPRRMSWRRWTPLTLGAALAPLACTAYAREGPSGLRGAQLPYDITSVANTANVNAHQPFVLSALLIEGASVYEARELAVLYQDRLASEVTVTDLAAIADAITARYRSDGYFLSRAIVPSQSFTGGVARIRVYEGHIAQVRFDGEPHPLAVRVLDGITEVRPVRLRDLDRRLALLRDTPGGVLDSPQLEPDLDDPGAHTLVVHFRVDRASGDINVDNRGADSYGGWRLYSRGALFSVFQPGDQVSLGLFTAPGAPDELLNGELSYSAPLNARGDTATIEAAGGAFSDDEDGTRTFRSLALRLSHPFSLGRRESLWGHLELAGLDVEKERAGATVIDEQIYTASASLFARRQGDASTTTFFSQVLVGRAASPLDSLRSRFDADAEFAAINFLARHTQSLEHGFSLQAALVGQIASGPLSSSEEIAFGGAAFGRGYGFGAARGDHGLGGYLEMRYAAPWDVPFFDAPQIYAFYDAATVWNAAPGGAIEDALASAGGGVRLNAAHGLFVQLETAKALLDAPWTDTNEDPWRRTMRVRLNF
jgi:hemolysin activation/secretion protein